MSESSRKARSATERFDVVIVGSGGAGLTAALVAHAEGAHAVVVEKASRVGGTFAYSTGLTWVPNNSLMRAAGIGDSEEEALAHIRELSGGRHDEAVLISFVRRSPKAIDWLRNHAGIPFEVVPNYPDYYAERTGGKMSGRHLTSPVFPAKELLPDEWRGRLISSPYYGALPVSWTEIQNWGGFGSIGRWDWNELARRVVDDQRGFGSATIGFLLAAVLERGIPIRLGSDVLRLKVDGGRVTGLVMREGGSEVTLEATVGVVLATGGYDGNDTLKRMWDPHPATIRLGAPGVDGSGVVMALEIGAAFEVLDGQLLIPTYRVPGEEANGEPLYRLCVREVAFPGSIIVNALGRRFCDESFYRDVCHRMAQWDTVAQSYPNETALFIFDQQWKDSYPLGPVGPGEIPPWLTRASSPAELAELLGLDPDRFTDTLERFNEHARQGADPDFNRGATLYARNNGDPAVSPNPCIRPLEGRLYAMPIRLGTSGTNGGIVTDPDGRVMHVRDRPIDGLYAAGNVAANLVEGLWYNSGTSNARGITFAYAAVRHMLGTDSRGE